MMKDVPALQLDPALPETILSSLSQVTWLKSWHTSQTIQGLETTFKDPNCLFPAG